MLRKGRDKEWSTRSRKYRQSEVLEWKKTRMFSFVFIFWSCFEGGIGWSWGSWKDNTGERRTITRHAASDQKQNLHAGEIKPEQLGLSQTQIWQNSTTRYGLTWKIGWKYKRQHRNENTKKERIDLVWKNKQTEVWSTWRRNCRSNILVQQTPNRKSK